MSKTLSNGTLSLRFMQNALRAKELKEVELERAEVVDEGKWEVSRAVREAWGLTKRDTEEEEEDADVHEASYLPFLFSKGSLEDKFAVITAAGRRVFKKEVVDVRSDSKEDTLTEHLPEPSKSTSPSKPSKGRIRAHPRPISISNLSSGNRNLLKGFDQLSGEDGSGKKPKPRSKAKGSDDRMTKPTARQLVFESGNVGVDLHGKSSAMASKSFMKPAGVDDPKELATVAAASSSSAKVKSEEVIDGARQKTKRIKRERDHDDGEAEIKRKSKRKKKKDRESVNE